MSNKELLIKVYKILSTNKLSFLLVFIISHILLFVNFGVFLYYLALPVFIIYIITSNIYKYKLLITITLIFTYFLPYLNDHLKNIILQMLIFLVWSISWFVIFSIMPARDVMPIPSSSSKFRNYIVMIGMMPLILCSEFAIVAFFAYLTSSLFLGI